jgi:hypothetical protein
MWSPGPGAAPVVRAHGASRPQPRRCNNKRTLIWERYVKCPGARGCMRRLNTTIDPSEEMMWLGSCGEVAALLWTKVSPTPPDSACKIVVASHSAHARPHIPRRSLSATLTAETDSVTRWLLRAPSPGSDCSDQWAITVHEKENFRAFVFDISRSVRSRHAAAFLPCCVHQVYILYIHGTYAPSEHSHPSIRSQP